METFPVMGIDRVCEELHFVERDGLPLLAHDVFDAFSESRVVTVMEYAIIPASTDREPIELYVVLDYVLVVVRLEVVNAIFCVSIGIDRAKLERSVGMKADQLSIQLGTSSESSIDGSNYSSAVPWR
jgi:hypothetical protein